MEPFMSGMDPEIFDAFIDQLRRYVRERLIPAEADVIAHKRTKLLASAPRLPATQRQ